MAKTIIVTGASRGEINHLSNYLPAETRLGLLTSISIYYIRDRLGHCPAPAERSQQPGRFGPHPRTSPEAQGAVSKTGGGPHG